MALRREREVAFFRGPREVKEGELGDKCEGRVLCTLNAWSQPVPELNEEPVDTLNNVGKSDVKGTGSNLVRHKYKQKKYKPRKKKAKVKKKRKNYVLNYINMRGGRKLDKWVEIQNQLKREEMNVSALAETHLRCLEAPPVLDNYLWGKCNRTTGMKEGEVSAC